MSDVRLHPYWNGMLCAETRDDIVQRMRQVLDGNYFTLVACNSYDENSDRFTSVDVSTSQRLRSPVEPWSDEPQYAGINWATSRYSMGVHTTAKNQAKARKAGHLDYVHFTFEPSRFAIDHYAIAGYRLRWIFVVEHHESDEATA